jgi:hypothetical protein
VVVCSNKTKGKLNVSALVIAVITLGLNLVFKWVFTEKKGDGK